MVIQRAPNPAAKSHGRRGAVSKGFSSGKVSIAISKLMDMIKVWYQDVSSTYGKIFPHKICCEQNTLMCFQLSHNEIPSIKQLHGIPTTFPCPMKNPKPCRSHAAPPSRIGHWECSRRPRSVRSQSESRPRTPQHHPRPELRRRC